MKILITTISSLFLFGCATDRAIVTKKETSKETFRLNTNYHVNAAWYQSGRKTANGEKFEPDGMTAAHKTLPFGTLVQLTYPKNGNSILVRINDRGPFTSGRDIDLARGAARAIEMKNIAKLEMTILSFPTKKGKENEKVYHPCGVSFKPTVIDRSCSSKPKQR
jgi:rare lipoprotein A